MNNLLIKARKTGMTNIQDKAIIIYNFYHQIYLNDQLNKERERKIKKILNGK
jgi:hypothetical protein